MKWSAVLAVSALAVGAVGFGFAQASGGTGNVLSAAEPCRLVDTRSGSPVGSMQAPLGPGETVALSLYENSGDCTEIPSGATVIEVQLTSIGATQDSFWTAYPADYGTRPTFSQLNPRQALSVVSNTTVVSLSVDGEFKLYNELGTSDVIIDVLGVFTSGSGETGPAGPAGPQGPTGATGESGLTGDAGIAGIDGDDGEVGPQGVAGISGVETVIGTESTKTPSAKSMTATCPVGKAAIGGGHILGDADDSIVMLLENRPTTSSEWTVGVSADFGGLPFSLTAYVICATVVS
ncbi:MAG: collagen-like protein [Ilumatobacteraceae bacterium]|nr:collagen-like protein [Ilumatobacteraceae bacterium]